MTNKEKLSLGTSGGHKRLATSASHAYLDVFFFFASGLDGGLASLGDAIDSLLKLLRFHTLVTHEPLQRLDALTILLALRLEVALAVCTQRQADASQRRTSLPVIKSIDRRTVQDGWTLEPSRP